MIITEPHYVFKGSLAGVILLFLPIAMIVGCFPMLGAPTALIALVVFAFRCRCAYWDRRFSNYAILILAIHLLLAPLLSSALIAMFVIEKLSFARAAFATLAPIISSLIFIFICGLKRSVESPFRVFKGKVVVDYVKAGGARWSALLGGAAALFGGYIAGVEGAQLIMALMIWVVGLYIIIYFQPAICGLKALRLEERRTGECFEFYNQKEIDVWRSRSIVARAVVAARNHLFRGRHH